MRAKLLTLFIAMACLDAAGKVFAHDADARAWLQRAAAHFGIAIDSRVGGINFDIFRDSPRHLLAGKDLYALYPETAGDRYKYSPTFALLFLPVGMLPWAISMFVWQLGNALALFYAMTRVLAGRAADLAIGAIVLEVWRSMQNSQSNALVAALIILAFVALEREKAVRAAAFVVVGTIVKLFPLAAGLFALPTKQRWRFSAAVAGLLVVAVLLPLLVASPDQLLAQYRSWLAVERVDATAHMQSTMGLLHIAGIDVPNVAIQIVGGIVLALPLARASRCWQDRHFRLLLLSSTLIFVVIFNHQAERASYVIAFCGIAIWFVTSARTPLDRTLFWIAFVSISVVSILVPGAWVRTPAMTAARLVLPCLAIWGVIQARLLRGEVGVVQSPATFPGWSTPPA